MKKILLGIVVGSALFTSQKVEAKDWLIRLFGSCARDLSQELSIREDGTPFPVLTVSTAQKNFDATRGRFIPGRGYPINSTIHGEMGLSLIEIDGATRLHPQPFLAGVYFFVIPVPSKSHWKTKDLQFLLGPKTDQFPSAVNLIGGVNPRVLAAGEFSVALTSDGKYAQITQFWGQSAQPFDPLYRQWNDIVWPLIRDRFKPTLFAPGAKFHAFYETVGALVKEYTVEEIFSAR